MRIKILGTGCARCHQVQKSVTEVVRELGVDATIEEVKDMKAIMEYPILSTPGLVIDDELVSSGKIPGKAEITRYIMNAMAKEAGD
ncbi:MAG: TM0996/MTH895 family glutaredoxin-like protein [Dehalococcoidia bacterium]|nr:TM0996/MTH895 family glutaredoxin-like protein [Dehalococcoidia bacterium]